MKEFWRRIWEKFKKPHGWQLFLLYCLTVAVCSAAIVFAIMGSERLPLQILSYVFYGLAGVTLAYSVYTIVIYAPGIRQKLIHLIKKTAFGRRMLEGYGFRTIIFAACSTAINIAYVAFHVVLAFMERSFWYGSLAAYYGMLVALKSGLVLYHRRKGDKDEKERKRLELRKYRTCGILLTIIPLCLVVPILQIVFLDKAFVHEGWTVIAFAAYAFYKIIMAVYNLVKARKEEDLTVQAVRSVGFADALVSIFSLQTALLFSFSEGENYAAMNALTGGIVCLFTIALGVTMLVKAHKKHGA